MLFTFLQRSALLSMFCALAAAQDCAPVTEIAPGVFVHQGVHAPVFEANDVSNSGFIVGERCVAVFDTGSRLSEGRALRCAIKRISPLPVCYIILSHMHPDHSLGAAGLRDDITSVIGHAKLPRALGLVGQYYLTRLQELAGESMPLTDILIPDRTVAEGQTLSLDLGARRITLRAHATAHTDNDLSLYDELTGTLWAGDLVFSEHIPVVDGSSKGWLAVLDELSQLPIQQLVPGHGPVQREGLPALVATRHYLEQLRQELRLWIDQGKTMLEAHDVVGQAMREHWALFDTYHKRNISKVYAEMEWE
jgi:quinoprotein relay system zinc metallohydrolase 2